MSEAHDYIRRWCEMFDSFCKKAIRNKVINIKQRQPKYREYEVLSEDPYAHNTPTETQSGYSEIDQYELSVGEIRGVTRHYQLYIAMEQLKKRQLLILLLSYWYDWSDDQIAEYIGSSSRTVRNLRKRAFRVIQHYLETGCKDCGVTSSDLKQFRPP